MKPGARADDAMSNPALVHAGVCFAVDSDGSNSVLRSLPIAILISEALTGKVLEANSAALALLGLERTSLLGKSLPEAGVDLVIDYGIGGRKGSRAQEALVTDSLGSRISCRLITSTAEIEGQRILLTVLLDAQLQAVLLGRPSKRKQADRQSETQAEKRGGQSVRSSVAIIADPSESTRESAAEMLKMLGLSVFPGATVAEAVSGLPEGASPSLIVVDSSLTGGIGKLVEMYPGARVIVAATGASARDEIGRNGWFEVAKPFSINELASAVSRALG